MRLGGDNCKDDNYGFDKNIDNHLSEVWASGNRANANQCLSVLLWLQGMWREA